MAEKMYLFEDARKGYWLEGTKRNKQPYDFSIIPDTYIYDTFEEVREVALKMLGDYSIIIIQRQELWLSHMKNIEDKNLSNLDVERLVSPAEKSGMLEAGSVKMTEGGFELIDGKTLENKT